MKIPSKSHAIPNNRLKSLVKPGEIYEIKSDGRINREHPLLHERKRGERRAGRMFDTDIKVGRVLGGAVDAGTEEEELSVGEPHIPPHDIAHLRFYPAAQKRIKLHTPHRARRAEYA